MSLVIPVMTTVTTEDGDLGLSTISTTTIRNTGVEIDGVYTYEVTQITSGGDITHREVMHRRTDLADRLASIAFGALS